MQPLAALYPTVRLSHWRQVRENIHSTVWTPGTTWSVVHPGGLPLLAPHSSWWLGDMGLTHGDWSGLLSGGLPPVPLDLVSPQKGFSRGTLTPRVKCFPATRILPITFVCFLCTVPLKIKLTPYRETRIASRGTRFSSRTKRFSSHYAIGV